ncbi:hypothetical protein NZK35_26895 [Stieleria sp. ICT_E10.1]|uniref:hypothetical protein n=1 Tax=Stieleria sedimenti TaxID=2976331 RepID=UPI00217F6F8A|nr:hypothetical protein [Stieleria sedimenti]MCS7470292.1 hypothetical protein [Stieleria sedimenti]
MNRIVTAALLWQVTLPALLIADEPQKSSYGIWETPVRDTIWIEWKPDLSALRTQIQSLVDRYYDGCVVKNDDGRLTFGHRTRSFWIHHSYRDGMWQDASEEIGPNSKGIYCTIATRSGNTRTGTVVPQKINRHYYVEYWMAPYSQKLDGKLLVSLRYPSDVDATFVSEFEALVNQFDKFVHDPSKPD